MSINGWTIIPGWFLVAVIRVGSYVIVGVLKTVEWILLRIAALSPWK